MFSEAEDAPPGPQATTQRADLGTPILVDKAARPYFDGHGKLQVWDLPTGKLNTRTFPSLYGPDQWTSLLVSPDDKSCAIYNVDRVKGKGTLFLYKTSDLTLLGRIALDASHVPIGFSTDGKQLLIAGPSFSWYDARKGQKVKSFKLEGWSFRKDMTWCKLISGSNL